MLVAWATDGVTLASRVLMSDSSFLLCFLHPYNRISCFMNAIQIISEDPNQSFIYVLLDFLICYGFP